jgi:hypothetical protein
MSIQHARYNTSYEAANAADRILCAADPEIAEENDLTPRAPSAVLGTTQQVYSRYESGENEMPIRRLITLTGFCNISAD